MFEKLSLIEKDLWDVFNDLLQKQANRKQGRHNSKIKFK